MRRNTGHREVSGGVEGVESGVGGGAACLQWRDPGRSCASQASAAASISSRRLSTNSRRKTSTSLARSLPLAKDFWTSSRFSSERSGDGLAEDRERAGRGLVAARRRRDFAAQSEGRQRQVGSRALLVRPRRGDSALIAVEERDGHTRHDGVEVFPIGLAARRHSEHQVRSGERLLQSQASHSRVDLDLERCHVLTLVECPAFESFERRRAGPRFGKRTLQPRKVSR